VKSQILSISVVPMFLITLCGSYAIAVAYNQPESQNAIVYRLVRGFLFQREGDREDLGGGGGDSCAKF
jgi:hypothetical protein